jgi:hypothetical protein
MDDDEKVPSVVRSIHRVADTEPDATLPAWIFEEPRGFVSDVVLNERTVEAINVWKRAELQGLHFGSITARERRLRPIEPSPPSHHDP